MPIGSRALDPNARYVVYEFSVNNRVYYVGVARQDSIRATDRWRWVERQLERLKEEGVLPPRKAKSLLTPSIAVVKALIKQGLKPHRIAYPWRGIGRAEALRQEALRINQLLAEGCVLANVSGNPRPASASQVLKYLGYGGAVDDAQPSVAADAPQAARP
jgi:hypothetical protein